MQDSGGTSSCFNTSSQTFDTGHYTYSLSGNTLTLTLISDNCSGRATTLTETNWTGQSSSDTTAPSTPTNLNATAATTSQINLNWSASTDNVGIAGYKIFRNGTLITTTLDTVFSDTGLTSNTTYTYTVSAYDTSGNVSDKSSPDSATTNESSTPTYSISGTVSGAVTSGVIITLSGAGSASTTTGSGGSYNFTDLSNGTYTITPSKTGYTFSPTNRSITVNNVSVANQKFTATATSTNPLIGTWYATTVDGNPVSKPNHNYMTYSDNTYTILWGVTTADDCIEYGSYSHTSSNINLAPSYSACASGKASYSMPYTLSGNNLTISGNGHTVVYVKGY
jgi:chitodextrinase